MMLEGPVYFRLAVGAEELEGKLPNPDHRFVLSHLTEGKLSLEHMVQLCHLPEPRIVSILDWCERRGWVVVE